MPSRTLEWPRKTRELQNNHFDSTIWNDFRFRDDDVIISTYAKSGTTWMQQIVGQLLSDAGPAPFLGCRGEHREIFLWLGRPT